MDYRHRSARLLAQRETAGRTALLFGTVLLLLPLQLWADEPSITLYPRSDPNTPAQDSSPGLQAAINQTSNGEVRIPKGMYDLYAPINLKSDVTLTGGTYIAHDLNYVFGAGADRVSIVDVKIHGDFNHGIWFAPAHGYRIGRCQIFGGTGHGIFLNSVATGVVHDNVIGSGEESPYSPDLNKFTTGINIGPMGGTGNWIIGNQVTHAAAGGIICNNMAFTIVEDNVIFQIGGNGINTGYGIQFYELPPSPVETTANIARRNLVMGTDGSGIYLRGSSATTIDSNTLVDVVRTQVDNGALVVAGIAIAPDYDDENPVGVHQDTLVRDNVVFQSGQGGISFYGRGVTIRGNFCGQATFGILVRGAIGCTIENNTIRSCLFGLSHWSWQPYAEMVVKENVVEE